MRILCLWERLLRNWPTIGITTSTLHEHLYEADRKLLYFYYIFLKNLWIYLYIENQVVVLAMGSLSSVSTSTLLLVPFGGEDAHLIVHSFNCRHYESSVGEFVHEHPDGCPINSMAE